MHSSLGSWGFDVNRSTNGSTDHPMIKRTMDDNARSLANRPSNGEEFSSIDRFVRGRNQDSTRMNQYKNELIAWQDRMLEKDQQHRPKTPNEFPTSQASTRFPPRSTRPASAMSSTTDSHQLDHHHHEPMIKSARVIKRYIELLYHLQAFYQRLIDDLFGGNYQIRTSAASSISIYHHHCRRIIEQVQRIKPSWDEKLLELQNLLKDISNFQTMNFHSEIAFLQRRSTLLNLMETLTRQNEADATTRSILNDIDHVIHQEKLALQLQDELLTLLQHQSLLHDFTSLLQWHRSIYSNHDQTRLQTLLPFLYEQMQTIDSYISHVSQQLTEIVMDIRALEKYILSYTNTVPLLDDGMMTSPPTTMRTIRREEEETRSRPVDETTSRIRSQSMPRYIDPDRQTPSSNRRHTDNLEMKNSNNNNNNNHHPSIPTSVATIRPTRRDQHVKPTGILKPAPPPRLRSSSTEGISDTDMNAIAADIFQWHEIDAQGKTRRIAGKSHEPMSYDSQMSDEDVPSPFNRRRQEPIPDQTKMQTLQYQLAEEVKRRNEENARKKSHRKTYYEPSMDYPNS